MSNNQFSLKTLMISVGIICVLCGIFFTAPEWVAGIFLAIVMFLAMPIFLALLVYGRDEARAFALGTMPPLAVLFTGFLQIGGRFDSLVQSGNSLDDKIFFAVAVSVVFVSGFIGQAVRWWCLEQKQATSELTGSPQQSGDSA